MAAGMTFTKNNVNPSENKIFIKVACLIKSSAKKGGLYCSPVIPEDSWGFLGIPRTQYWLMCQPIFSVLWGYIPEDWRES
jgi:hypothetical protein